MLLHYPFTSFLFKKFILLGFIFLFCAAAFGHGKGHKIKGIVEGYEGNTAYLSMLYGGNHYVVDTATVTNGSFLFESIYDLYSGVYLVVLPPSKSFLILVDQKVNDLAFEADMSDIEGSIRFESSPDNVAYYEYLRFFRDRISSLDQIKAEYDVKPEGADRMALLAKMQQLKKEVINYQKDLVERLPGSLTAAMVKCELLTEIPSFEGSPEEIQLKKYFFQKEHFFDNTDLTDERLIRAPKNVLVDRVDTFLDHLTMQHPDSLISSVDYILQRTASAPESYRFFLTHIFNKYREAKSIGMDAVYVHIAEKYIATGKASWIEEQERKQVLAAVALISPTLIGKTAPDFTVQKEDGQNISLHEIKSPYTVLFFWSPNCAHCQQSMPQLKSFYEANKEKGIQVFAVCTKVNTDEANCWDFIDKNEYGLWINASDQMGGSSKIHTQYNIKTTPKIYVLDKDKKILAKDLGIEHLGEVMKRITDR